jgi:hypothetical protein
MPEKCKSLRNNPSTAPDPQPSLVMGSSNLALITGLYLRPVPHRSKYLNLKLQRTFYFTFYFTYLGCLTIEVVKTVH